MYKPFWIYLFIIVSFFQLTNAEEKIAFIDIDKIMNESEFGKKSYKTIDDNYEKEKKKLLKTEKNLISKEKEILNQKNILSEEELNNKISELRIEINNFQKKRKLANEKFNQMKLDKTNFMVQNLNAILSKYADENNISLVIQKKYIVIAKSGLDITEKILTIFNEQVKN